MSSLAYQLEERGTVPLRAMRVRTASASDGRAQTLALTAAGRALVPDLAALADVADAAFFDGLTAAERERLEQLLRKVAAHGRMTAVPVQ